MRCEPPRLCAKTFAMDKFGLDRPARPRLATRSSRRGAAFGGCASNAWGGDIRARATATLHRVVSLRPRWRSHRLANLSHANFIFGCEAAQTNPVADGPCSRDDYSDCDLKRKCRARRATRVLQRLAGPPQAQKRLRISLNPNAAPNETSVHARRINAHRRTKLPREEGNLAALTDYCWRATPRRGRAFPRRHLRPARRWPPPLAATALGFIAVLARLLEDEVGGG